MMATPRCFIIIHLTNNHYDIHSLLVYQEATRNRKTPWLKFLIRYKPKNSYALFSQHTHLKKLENINNQINILKYCY